MENINKRWVSAGFDTRIEAWSFGVKGGWFDLFGVKGGWFVLFGLPTAKQKAAKSKHFCGVMQYRRSR